MLMFKTSKITEKAKCRLESLFLVWKTFILSALF